MTQLAPFPCPRCGEHTAVPISYQKLSGLRYRERECPDCGRFVTHQNGGPEEYQHFVGERPEPEPFPELEPLDLAALDPVREALERARLRAIWEWETGELRPARLRAGSGYEGDRKGAFYEE